MTQRGGVVKLPTHVFVRWRRTTTQVPYSPVRIIAASDRESSYSWLRQLSANEPFCDFQLRSLCIVKMPSASETNLNILSKIISRLVMLFPHYEPVSMRCRLGEPRGFRLVSCRQLYIRDASEISFRIRQRFPV
jgi:hypothetical protein